MIQRRESQRQYDVIVWGASGYTGRLVAEYLLGRYRANGDLRWAMGGRDREKLEAIRADLGAAEVPLLTGDSHDRASLEALVTQTRVVCTTVGPYARYGSELVEACAKHGTDYCDLSGEVPWMRRMIDAHETATRESGARIVHCCGFDSIPSDIGVFFLQQELKRRHGSYAQAIKFRLRAAKGGPSGGTVASLMNVIEEARRDRSVARTLANPYGLNPDGEQQGPDRRDLQGVAYDADLKSWIAPFVMAAINTKVVRRSNALMGYAYGQDFRYEEAMIAGPGIGGRLKALGIACGIGALMAGAALAPTRALLNRFVLPKPGQGPSPQQREAGYFNIILIGRLAEGSIVRARVTGDRDPGYGSTSKMLGESAVCLAKDLDDASVGGGFWTPASALGAPLLERLKENAGLTFEIEEQ